MAGDGRSMVNRETAAEANDGKGAPVRFGQGEVVWELRGLMTELARVSARAEDGCSGGSTVAWSSPVFCGWRRCVLGSGSEEQAKERVEWLAGAFVRLVRALGEGGGLSLGRATATARWRPWGGSGRRGEGRGAPAQGKGRWRRSSAMRGRQREAGRGRKQSRGARGTGKGPKRNF